MLFEVGETVVYPHHGAATITEVKTRIIKGEEKLYLKLNVTQGDLTIEVPAENVDLVGVRDVIGQEGLDKVFEVLRAPLHRGAHELVTPVQSQPREARLRRRDQGLRGGA
jgi:CarD family transcriptional regulator